MTEPAARFGSVPPPEATLLGEHEGVAQWALRGRLSLVDDRSMLDAWAATG